MTKPIEAEKQALRLYVVGESSGNPDDWSEFGDWGLVVARSLEEALSMTETGRAAKVEFNAPAVLCRMPLTGND